MSFSENLCMLSDLRVFFFFFFWGGRGEGDLRCMDKQFRVHNSEFNVLL